MFTMQHTTRTAGPRAQPPILNTKVATLCDAAGHHAGTFEDVVDLLQVLPALDPHYSCSGGLFRENGAGRSYDLAWELDDAVDAVRRGGRWSINEKPVGDLIGSDY